MDVAFRIETQSPDPLSLRERVGVRVKSSSTYPLSSLRVRVKSSNTYPSLLPQVEGWGEGGLHSLEHAMSNNEETLSHTNSLIK